MIDIRPSLDVTFWNLASIPAASESISCLLLLLPFVRFVHLTSGDIERKYEYKWKSAPAKLARYALFTTAFIKLIAFINYQ